MSQKNVAADLGISQALLSHYENGIRECSLEFVVKVADYYNVTTDYLLGKSKSKYGFTDQLDLSVEMPSDHYPCIATSFRAACALRELLGECDTLPAESRYSTSRLYAISIFRILIYGMMIGKIPPKWINVEGDDDLVEYAQAVEAVVNRILDVPLKRSVMSNRNVDMPACLKTLIDEAQETFADNIRSLERLASAKVNKRK